MTTYLVRNPVVFNANSIVHVDETAISGRCKYGRGREIPIRWLFGIVDRANHKCFAQFIDDKSHPSIIPIITNHVNGGGQQYILMVPKSIDVSVTWITPIILLFMNTIT